MAEQEKLPDLEEDILLDILSRLPVKNLLQLKVVCKHWCALISSDYFIQLHVTRATHLPNFDSWRFAMVENCSRGEFGVRYQNIVDVFDCNGIKLGSGDMGRRHPKTKLLLMGSCNGLLLILDAAEQQRNLFLCNPSIKYICQSIQLPPALRYSYPIVSGLGYDDNQYKAMFGVCTVGRIPTLDVYMEMYVYCCKTNSWKKIKEKIREYMPHLAALELGLDEDVGLFSSTKAVSLKGALHWPSKDLLKKEEYIGVLDLRKEELKKMKLPERAFGCFRCMMGVLKGCLYIGCCGYGHYSEIWVMKEYGVAESWSKVLWINDSDNFKQLIPLYFRMLAFGEDRRLQPELAVLVTEDDELKKMMTIGYKMFIKFPFSRVTIPYIESLVDPKNAF